MHKDLVAVHTLNLTVKINRRERGREGKGELFQVGSWEKKGGESPQISVLSWTPFYTAPCPA